MMGGNRKSKGQQNRRGSASGPTKAQSADHAFGGNNHHRSGSSSSIYRSSDFDGIFQDVGATYQVSWAEILFVGASVLLLACMVVGSALISGMVISIHFFDNTNIDGGSFALDDMADDYSIYTVFDSFLYNAPPSYMKVTTLDPLIASVSSTLPRDGSVFDFTSAASGQFSFNLLLDMVVEEVEPLYPSNGSSSFGKSDSFASFVHNGFVNDDCQTDICRYFARKGHNAARKVKPLVNVRAPKVLPSLCPDKQTIGFSDWKTFKAAVQEANSISAEKFMKWNEYFANYGHANVYFEDDSYYYEEDVVFTICPGAILKARKDPIFINAENLLIECDDCIVDGRGAHLTFGPHAKSILVRGVTFRNSQSSSLTFHHDGAEASFEDCRWTRNSDMDSDGKNGAVADVNSTSTVNFFRCEVGYGTQTPPNLAASLSIRPNARGGES